MAVGTIVGMKRLPVTVLAGGFALIWGALLLVVWAAQPVQSFARYVPVESPSAVERTSIEEVFRGIGGSSPVVGNELSCESTPLDVATGSGAATTAPPIPAGFEYVERACSSAYGDARIAFWMNALAIVVVLAASVALHLRRSRGPAAPATSPRADAATSVTT